MPLANVALTDTFDTWRTRTNQIIVSLDQNDGLTANAYNKANSANVLAYNTGIGANAFAAATVAGANTAVGTGANTYLLVTLSGANTAIGAGANAFAAATVAGANAFTSATVAGANTAVGGGANTYLLATLLGANTAVGTGANTYLLATLSGAKTAVGGGANTVGVAAFAKANTAVTSVTGTTNQISVSGTTSVTLSTPQSIATTSSVQFGSFGVGTAGSGTTGEIRATNNITAYYSDMRLKNKIETIQNALDKVMSLSGFFFVNNETAKKYGYISNEIQVGVSAQEVQAVLPEVVTAAPFDIGKDDFGNEYSKSAENYLTVRYEKLVPLLIEAIKAQQIQIEELRAKIEE